MTTHTPFTCFGVAVRLFAVSVLCAVLFYLDRIFPSLLGFDDYFRVQDATIYLWLVLLPLASFAWVLQRSRYFASRSAAWRWAFSLALALVLTVAFAFATLGLIWNLG